VVITKPKPGTDFNKCKPSKISFNAKVTDDRGANASKDYTYEWRSSRDGVLGNTLNLKYDKDSLARGEHDISLIAFKSGSQVKETYMNIFIDDDYRIPVATIKSPNPNSGKSFDEGDEITFKGTGVDCEDGHLSGESLVWTSDVDLEIGSGESFDSKLSPGSHIITLTATDNDGNSATDQYFIYVGETLIELSSFSASAGSRRVTLQWTTESENSNSGFNIFRSDTEDGEYIKINDSLIAAQGSPLEGADYEFADKDVRNREVYYYKLEDIDYYGTANMHGPVSVRPRLIYGIKTKIEELKDLGI
jgi:hypothetical protein